MNDVHALRLTAQTTTLGYVPLAVEIQIADLYNMRNGLNKKEVRYEAEAV